LRGLTSLKLLRTLADVYDEKAHAISFYFSRASFSETSHKEEVLGVKHLVDRVTAKCDSKADTAELFRDLAMILEMERQIPETPERFKSVFACSRKHIWQEYDLPICENVSRLELSTHFQLVPLLRALESCTPYGVVIVENGKAKGFIIHGAEIHELDVRLPSADLSVHADDSRVGWSHHIDSNVSERRKRYMKELAVDLHRLLQAADCPHLVIGVREDVWSELEPQLDKAGLAAMVAGRFHLASFDLTPAEVLQAARPVFHQWQSEQYGNFWQKLREQPAHSAVGVEPVLRSLETGRVQKLFLGNVPNTKLYACIVCSKWSTEVGDKCPACGKADVYEIPADELVVRKALLTDVEILAPDSATAGSFGTAAILRY
jgi:rubrerythrin